MSRVRGRSPILPPPQKTIGELTDFDLDFFLWYRLLFSDRFKALKSIFVFFGGRFDRTGESSGRVEVV